MELAHNYFANKEAKYNKNLNRSLKTLDKNKDDIYAGNSVELNTMNRRAIPVKDAIFNMLFDHQEGIKQILKTEQEMKYGGKALYGFDDNDPL